MVTNDDVNSDIWIIICYYYWKSREIVIVENLKPIFGSVIDYAKNIKYEVIVTIE